MVVSAFPLKIGLEVHGYLNTREKLFCMCRTSPEGAGDDLVNTRVCPICTGQPGSKPMAPNEEVVKKMVEIAWILGSKINFGNMVWQRKHYDWADLPKGYQTTISGKHVAPCALGGSFHGIKITEAHLEEDPAQWNPETGGINYNRSGLPLIEIVTEPEFLSSEQVVDWLKALILSLSYVKAIRRNAGIKVDVNISTYGERVEMKNLNSLEKIRKAIEYEVVRQVENYRKGVLQKRETLAFDERIGKTVKMREKEGASDYRFIVDPDLSTVRIEKKIAESVKRSLPEMPAEKLEKLLKKFKVDSKNAKILTKNLELVEFFEELALSGVDAKKNISWITIELLRVLNWNKKTLEDEDIEILPEHLAELISLVDKGKITVLKGKQIMNDFVPKSFSIRQKGDIEKIADDAVENLCRQVIEENGHVVQEYRDGKATSLNYLIGQVMKLSERRADFKVVGETLRRLIK